MINAETTVREVAIQLPESTRLFEQLKIDYCCGGNQRLADACTSAGLDVDTVIEQLAEVTQPNAPEAAALDFADASLPELIEHILNTHHVFTWSEIDRLEVLKRKVIGAHGSNHPELFRLGELLQSLSADLKPHMFKEEKVLFPYMLSMAQAADQNQPRPFAPFETV